MSTDSNLPKKKSTSGSGRRTELARGTGFLVLGAAMLIWPKVISPAGYTCDPGAFHDELLGCFIATAWGKPEAIALCFITGMLIAGPAVRSRWSAHRD